jgi:D-beta-D-heptose 7-phosphate kinase/D-beta-D-heptose 1-phosphate adenosyltransferase
MANEPLEPALPKLPNLASTHVIVVGDLMVDRYWHGAAERVSQEAPVPVVAINTVEERPGGAANVALNVVALGAGCTLIGVVGDDPTGARLEATLQAAGVRCEFVRAEQFETITKIRIMGQGQQMLRADFESQVPPAAAQAVVERLQQCMNAAVDAVVIEDYEKGTIDDAQALISLCGTLPVVVDPKNKPLAAFRGAAVVKPNEAELRQWLLPWPSEADLPGQLERLRATHQIGAIVLTRGVRGMLVADGQSTPLQLPARHADVFDVTGAGDTVAATLAACLAAKLPLRAAARLANLAASLAVAKAGTAAISAPELRALIDTEERSDRGLLSNAQLLEFAGRARAAGQRIVFTNGCFDILHAGHVTYLQEARALGDRLVVAINDDAAVTRLKGVGRPVNSLARRAQVLAALAAVDWVVAFSEDTPERLLAELQPEMLVKGGDYTPGTVVGADVVEGYGGEVRVLSLVEEISTTRIVDRLRGG